MTTLLRALRSACGFRRDPSQFQLLAPLLTSSGLTYEQPDGRHNEGRFTPTPHGTGLATTELTLNSGDTPRHFSGGNGDRTAHRLVVPVEAGALGRSLEPSPARRFHDTLLQGLQSNLVCS